MISGVHNWRAFASCGVEFNLPLEAHVIRCVCVVVVIVARLQVADPPSNSTRIQVAYSCREKPEFVVLESVNVSAEEAISGLGWSNGWAQFCY